MPCVMYCSLLLAPAYLGGSALPFCRSVLSLDSRLAAWAAPHVPASLSRSIRLAHGSFCRIFNPVKMGNCADAPSAASENKALPRGKTAGALIDVAAVMLSVHFEFCRLSVGCGQN